MRTKFLNPLGTRAVLNEIEKLSEVTAVAYGGYPHAERCRVVIMREELMETHEQDIANIAEVLPLKIVGNFLMMTAEHSDFLGAFSGIGLKSEDMGDIIVQADTGCLTFTSPEIASKLEKKLQKVRGVAVKVERVAQEEMAVPAARVKDTTSVEHSMRLDAIASAGFGMAREKMNAVIKAGDVQLNWKTVVKPTAGIGEGDVISCKGKGRVVVTRVTLTKKLKYSVEMTCFS